MFSAYLQDIHNSPFMREFDSLGNRLFLFDGINANLALNGHSLDDRIMGCFPQQALATPTAVSGAGLSAGASLSYAIRRVIKIAGQEIYSSVTLANPLELSFNTLFCSTGHALLAAFQAIADGEFKFTLDGNDYNITGVDTTGATSLADVAATIQSALRTSTGNIAITCAYSTDHFEIKADKTMTPVAGITDGIGTDISSTGGICGRAGQATYTAAANLKAAIILNQYEFAPIPADARAKNYYQIFRNKPENSTVLYMVDELSQEEFVNVADTWVTDTAYKAGDNSKSSTVLYVSLKDHTSGASTEPGTGADWQTYWRIVPISANTAWVTDTVYAANNVRRNGNLLYTCKTAHTSSAAREPGLGADWHTYWVKHGTATYTDSLADADLAVSPVIDLSAEEQNTFVPPCRFARAYKGAIVCGGSDPYSEGRISVETASLTKVKIHAGPAVRPTDIGANIALGTDPIIHTITDVDPVKNEYTITPASGTAYPDAAAWATGTAYVENDRRSGSDGRLYNCIADHTSAAINEPGTGADWDFYWENVSADYVLFRDPDTVYVTKPLPDDIESYALGTELYPNFADSKLKGIATHAGICYTLRSGGVESLEGTYESGFTLAPIAGAPPGCRSHATIVDDRHKAPFLMYYSGEAGVVAISGGAAKIMSDNISDIFRYEVDHAYDDYTHAVYDPAKQLYHLWLFRVGEVTATNLRVPQMMLTYDLKNQTWVSGELAASASGLWIDASGIPMVVVGIAGGVAKLADVGYDGLDISGTLVNADTVTTTGFTDVSANFPVSAAGVVGLCGLPIHLSNPAGTIRIRSIIKSNTATAITVYGPWETTPAAGWKYHIGAIRWYLETGELGFTNSFEFEKKNNRVFAIGDCQEYDAWAIDTPYVSDDKIDKPDACYRCTSPHTATAANEPGVGANWATVWEKLEVNVKISVRGTRDAADRIGAATFDLKKSDKMELPNNQLGIRSRGYVVRMEGDGTEPLGILALSPEEEPVTKKR